MSGLNRAVAMATLLRNGAGEFLYHSAFPLYRTIYSGIKRCSDGSEIRLCRRLIQPGDVVLDLGANIGFYTTLFAELVGEEGAVHAFEPDAQNFLRLQLRTNGLCQVLLAQKAVSDRQGVATLYRSRANRSHSLCKPVWDSTLCSSVEVTTVDANLADRLSVDFVKVDVEGHEGKVLDGMTDTLKNSPRLVLLIEIYPRMLARAGTELAGLIRKIKASGLFLFESVDGSWRSVGEQTFIERASNSGHDFHENIVLCRDPARIENLRA
jgi:FkbM family methyltransferase